MTDQPTCQLECRGDQLAGTCEATILSELPSGGLWRFCCTRDPGHDGPHVACAFKIHDVLVWGEDTPAEAQP